MRKQEQGLWRGGMLAVCLTSLLHCTVLTQPLAMLLFRTRWGKCIRLTWPRRHIHLVLYRMGKTIQIISLFVSDPHKPNLVVA